MVLVNKMPLTLNFLIFQKIKFVSSAGALVLVNLISYLFKYYYACSALHIVVESKKKFSMAA